jgi:hypothetical protein
MDIKYVHTNIVSDNWESLADFYINVFNCQKILPKRNISENWLEKGTGVKNASLSGIHLILKKVLAVSSIFIVRGKNGAWGRGGIYIAIGIIIPIVFLIIF